MIGQKVGAYEVLAKLGEGGMGEVYRARDSKLNRDVALKVLPSLFTDDPDRLARFDREARLLASLNHPNIAHVYGLEEGTGNLRAIAMELVDGVTLAERIGSTTDRAGLPVAPALAIARQIAAALESAHDAGIVHRDLKPANVKVKDDGTVKVLDFGLAKALDTSPESGGGATNSPTLTARATQLGMVLGTAAYMAPEQAKGKSVDRRADVWAFGAVLYEMLTGRRAFEGDDISDVMAAVLKVDPDWTALPADVPEPVRRLLRRCLEKDPKRRLRDIGEGMVQLEDGLSGATLTGLSPAVTSDAIPAAQEPARARPLWRRVAAIASPLVGVAGIGLAAYVLMQRTPPPAGGPVRFQHIPDPAFRVAVTQNYWDLTLSPDGRTLVYTGTSIAGPRLYLRRLDELQASPVRGGEGGYGPFVSPDNEWVGFHDGGEPTRLKKVSVFGGPPVVIVKAAGPITGASWATDGPIVYGVFESGLHQVVEGAAPTVLTTVDKSLGEEGHILPHAIANSPVVLFATVSRQPWSETAQLAAVDRKTGSVVRLNLAGSRPQYVESGHIVYIVADGSLRAVRFDPDRMAVSGNPVPVHDGVGMKSTSSANFAVTPAGHLAYMGGGTATRVERTLVWVDRTGRETASPAPPRTYFYARVSPDGARIALDVRDDQQDVWIWDARGTMTRLTAGQGSDEYGLWTPNGGRIISYSTVNQKTGLYSSRTDITGVPELIVERPNSYPNDVTPDGKTVIFRSVAGSKGKNDLFAVPLAGERTVTTLLGTEHDELNAAISPDGKWIAYQSDLSSKVEIYVSPYPNVAGGQSTISTAGGSEPVWSPTTRELFYLASDGKLMVVPYEAAPQFVPGTPAPLFSTTAYYFGGVGRNYDVSRNGQRFIMVKEPQTGLGGSTPITVVLNWVDELNAKLPRR